MSKCKLQMAIVLFALCTLTSGTSYALDSLTVMADSSISVAVASIARDFSRENQVAVNTSFAPQGEQEAQINGGGAADILITCRQPWIDKLKLQGLVDIYSQEAVAKNRLALVGPADSPLHAKRNGKIPFTALLRQMSGEGSFAVGNPEYLPEGIYAKEALRNLSMEADLEPYTVYPKDLDEMLDLVGNHQAYGLFFYSTVIDWPGGRVITLLPESSHKPIRYFAVALAGANMSEARKFLTYLKSDDAQEALRENGFAVE